MKKLLLLLMIVALVGSGCTKEECRCNKHDLPIWKIVDYSIFRSEWELIGEAGEIGSYYYYVADVPELTQRVYDDGLFLCYYLFRDEHGIDVQTPLPFSAYYIDAWKDDYGNDWETPWSEHFSYDVATGSIAFKLVYSNFYTGNPPPARCDFRLVLLY